MSFRPPAVAGSFYPAQPAALAALVSELLEAAPQRYQTRPKALIVPHAGFPYSGPVAASAYRALLPWRADIHKVVLFGPAHRVYFEGMAFPSANAFSTPLGDVALDRNAIDRALQLPRTDIRDDAHDGEHCLEVQLPFLQSVVLDFELIPAVVGACPAAAVAQVLETLWGGDETLIVVSSDLSHYQPYASARRRDGATNQAIEQRATDLVGEDACGAYAINGLMLAARTHGLTVRNVDLRNSGDTAGDRAQVVGYGAYILGS